MSTAQAAAKSQAQSAPPPAPVQPPPQVRPLSPSQIGLAEHMVRHHVVTLPIGTAFEDCLHRGGRGRAPGGRGA